MPPRCQHPPSFNLTPHCPYGSQLGLMMEYFALSIVLKLQALFLGYTLNIVNEELGRRKKDEQKEGTPVIWYPSDTASENKREKRIAYNDAHTESHIQRHTPKHRVGIILKVRSYLLLFCKLLQVKSSHFNRNPHYWDVVIISSSVLFQCKHP